MTHVSRKILPPPIEQTIYNLFTYFSNTLGKEKETASFLNSLLTKTEKIMLAKRLAMAILLEEKQTDQAISDTLNLTRITVAKFKAETKAGQYPGLLLAIKRLSRQNKFLEFKKTLLGYTAKVAQKK